VAEVDAEEGHVPAAHELGGPQDRAVAAEDDDELGVVEGVVRVGVLRHRVAGGR
jgi:hypothetical protein